MSTLAQGQQAADAAAAALSTGSSRRMRPASVSGQLIYIECESWCVTDHVLDEVRHLEDLEHAGKVTDLAIPGGPGYQLLVHARLGWDPFGDRHDCSPYVLVEDESESFRLSSAEAMVLADHLEVFVQQVRNLASSLAMRLPAEPV